MTKRYSTISVEYSIGERITQLSAARGLTRPQFLLFLLDDYLRKQQSERIQGVLSNNDDQD